MPLFYIHNFSEATKIAVWQIAEPESFFLQKVPLSNNVTHWLKRLQHLAGRFLLQELFPDFPYHLIKIADTRKPFLPNEEYHFSISHCGDYAAVIVSKESRVGIDIELVSNKVEKIKNKFLNKEELENFNLESPEISFKQLTLLWSCKESVFKWYGNGNVDFRNHINLKQVVNSQADTVLCDFLKEQKVSLSIRHKFFDDLCLAWIIQ
jgi:phosphopantetheinyl transferase